MSLMSNISPWSQTPVLSGTHVSLEPLRSEHADGLRAVVKDGRLWELVYTNVPRPEDMDAYIGKALEKQSAGEQQAFVVRDAAGVIAGSTRFYELDPDTPRLQIGYTWYARRVQRTGLNTEAKLLLLAHAFETLGCASVGLETSSLNLASQAAIARLGAQREGVIRHHLRHRDGSLRDTINFSIIDAEWPTVKGNLQARLAAHAHG